MPVVKHAEEILAGRAGKRSGILIALAAVETASGAVALLLPFTAGSFGAIALGFSIGMAGIANGADAVVYRSLGRVFAGIVGIASGASLASDPEADLAYLTVISAAYLITTGFARLAFSVELGRRPGSAALAWTGAVSIVLGILLLNEWPRGGAWHAGILAGVNLLLGGAVSIAIAAGARSTTKAY